MNILLTGASGAVGSEALQQLVSSNKYKIRVFDLETKTSKKVFATYKDKIEIVFGDITNINDVEKISKEIDSVIHLAAIIPPLADEKPELAYKINTIGTKNLINSLEKYSPKAFFLYSSSVSVYGDRLKNYKIKVGDKLQASVGDEYAKTKIEAEKLIQESSLSWAIFRLSAIMGVGNHKMTGLMFHMPLDTKIEITSPRDTARAFVHALEKQEFLHHRIFNLGGGNDFRIEYQEFMKRNFEITGLGKLNFPPKAFAEKNFHCGHYVDGDELENILHFRTDNLDTYFEELKQSVPGLLKVLTRLFSPLIKRYMKGLSEPLHAIKDKDEKLLDRFFH